MDGLFNFPSVRIEQPGKVLEPQAKYEIFDTERKLLARVTETDARSRVQLLAWALPGSVPPETRALAVTTADGTLHYGLTKQREDWASELRRPNGDLVGRIKVVGTARRYALTDGEGHPIGRVDGDLKLRNFAITDSGGAQVGKLTKLWAGLAKELLTAADHYRVEFTGRADDPLRTLAVMMAVVLDLTFYGPT